MTTKELVKRGALLDGLLTHPNPSLRSEGGHLDDVVFHVCWKNLVYPPAGVRSYGVPVLLKTKHEEFVNRTAVS